MRPGHLYPSRDARRRHRCLNSAGSDGLIQRYVFFRLVSDAQGVDEPPVVEDEWLGEFGVSGSAWEAHSCTIRTPKVASSSPLSCPMAQPSANRQIGSGARGTSRRGCAVLTTRRVDTISGGGKSGVIRRRLVRMLASGEDREVYGIGPPPVSCP
jgi:hypothetical protein